MQQLRKIILMQQLANNDNNDAELKSQKFDPHEEFKHENVKVESVDDNVVQAVDDENLVANDQKNVEVGSTEISVSEDNALHEPVQDVAENGLCTSQL